MEDPIAELSSFDWSAHELSEQELEKTEQVRHSFKDCVQQLDLVESDNMFDAICQRGLVDKEKATNVNNKSTGF